ncbi:hypothetical protein EW146_g797 [Bondarzewia mesenterica]|uniref:Heme oxygenase n=1 Tax=Bondarzewia mesenterica TaxID=1095465 RepID=A0A4V3XG95_9AGAM|nr:hypothetical protein EW146_g797 [Bondarzewia mesenterica]
MAIINETTDLDLDLSLPIATLLRLSTAAAHETINHSAGAEWLTRGELDKEEYVRFLIMLWHVYDTLESALEKHSSNPALNPTYNPTLLARAPALLSDISHLLGVTTSEVQSHPLFLDVAVPTSQPVEEYTSRLRSLADSPDPAPLLAHAYVRYLGDLSGGQVVRRRVARAYGLEDEDGDVTILAEANKAYELNGGLFTSLKAPSSPPSPLSPLDSPSSHLGDPTTPVSPSFTREEEKPKEIPVQILQTHAVPEGNYTVSGVASFIAAMCLAHFILVVGGFTGSRGWEKFEAVQEWIAGLFH